MEKERPELVIIEKGAVKRLAEVLKRFDISKALVVTNPVIKGIAGDFIAKLVGANIFVIEDSTVSEVEKTKEAAAGCDGIVSVGGGRAIDVGKTAAFELDLPFVSVPTAPAHDGIASGIAVVSDNGVVASKKTRPPIAVVADIDIIKNAPYKFIAAGCGDMIANITAVFDWRLAKKNEFYSEDIAILSLSGAEKVIKYAEKIRERTDEGIKALVEALVDSGRAMTRAGSSRPASGAEHMFSHALDRLNSGKLHGQQCGLGAVLISCLQGENFEKIKSALKRLGCPVTAKEIGLDRKLIVKALVNADKVRERYTILKVKPLDEKKAEELCKKAGVF